MVCGHNTKRYIYSVLLRRQIPRQVIDTIFSYDTNIEDLLPRCIHQCYSIVEFDEDEETWTYVDEAFISAEETGDGDVYSQILTYYFVERGARPLYMHDNVEVIHTGEENVWLVGYIDIHVRCSYCSWRDEV